MRRKLFFTAVFLAGLARLAPAQTPDLILNPGSSYVDIGRGIPWGTPFNRTYVIVPNSPNASVCVYVVNNNPTNSHTFTTTTFQTADSQAADFSNNQGRYNSVPLLMPASVGASSMVSGFTQSTAAAKVAIQFSASAAAGGSPDTADVFLVQTTSGTCGAAAIAIPVQGPIKSGANGSQVNPLLCGGLDSSNLLQPCGVYKANVGLGAVAINGLAVGAPGQNTITQYANITEANGNGGPLGTANFAQIGFGNNVALAEMVSPSPYLSARTCTTTAVGCSGIYVSDAGVMDIQNIPNSNQTVAIGILTNQKTPIAVSACRFDVNVNSISGAGATLDIFVQDSSDGVLYTDRIHFPQVLTGGTLHTWGAFSAGQTTTTINPYTTNTLTANTILAGAPGKYFQVTYVETNTPSISGTVSMLCK